MVFYSPHCIPPIPALLHRVDTQLVHAGAGQFMKEVKGYLFLELQEEETENHSAERHSLDSSRSRHSVTSLSFPLSDAQTRLRGSKGRVLR